VLRLVVREATLLVGLGVLVGLPGIYAATSAPQAINGGAFAYVVWLPVALQENSQ